jgi:hypothetical protein
MNGVERADDGGTIYIMGIMPWSILLCGTRGR